MASLEPSDSELMSTVKS